MKRPEFPKETTIEFNIKDFADGIDAESAQNTTKIGRATNSYNFEYKNGVLTESVGFEDLTVPSTFEEGCEEIKARLQMDEERLKQFVKIFHYKQFNRTTQLRQDKIILVNSEFKAFYSRAISKAPIFTEIRGTEFQELPNLKNYTDGTDDAALFFDATDKISCYTIITPRPVLYPDSPSIYDFCEYKDRVFAVPCGERLSIVTDTPLLFNWTDETMKSATTIKFDSERGCINKLLTFNGYLFAVRDFGITRIYWYDDNRSYSLVHLLCSNSRIYPNTACVCGDRALVLCKDGIYEFDNLSTKKLDLKLGRLLDGVSNQHAVGAFRNGIYYIACRLNFGDGKQVGCEATEGYKNNALICFDTFSNKYSITRGIDIVDLCALQYGSADKLLALFNDENCGRIGQLTQDGKYFGVPEHKYWCSPTTDLGYSNKIKYIKEVSLLSLYDIKLKVFSECESREFDIRGGNVISRVPVRIKGKQIAISIESDTEKACVSNLKLIAKLLDDDYV